MGAMNRGALPLLAAAVLLAAGCNSHDSNEVPPVPQTDIKVLFIGNSHSSFGGLQDVVAEMVRTARPGETVGTAAAPRWAFLDEHIRDPESIALLGATDWTFVVLQAQRYFLVTRPQYPTDAAKEFVRMARQQHAVPILFPEWARIDVDETMLVYDLHVSIAQDEPACVSPIGQAWDLSLSRHPGIVLHNPDGNHSNPTGAFLTALILFATMTGASPLTVPDLNVAVPAATQALLRVVADDTIQAWPPRTWCPDDPF